METYNERTERYIKQRIVNLLDAAGVEAEKGNEMDAMWYKRAAQELEWALQILTNKKEGNCVLENAQLDLF